jgi:hypothetical protein
MTEYGKAEASFGELNPQKIKLRQPRATTKSDLGDEQPAAMRLKTPRRKRTGYHQAGDLL